LGLWVDESLSQVEKIPRRIGDPELVGQIKDRDPRHRREAVSTPSHPASTVLAVTAPPTVCPECGQAVRSVDIRPDTVDKTKIEAPEVSS
jgi:hypothetical protein